MEVVWISKKTRREFLKVFPNIEYKDMLRLMGIGEIEVTSEDCMYDPYNTHANYTYKLLVLGEEIKIIPNKKLELFKTKEKDPKST